MMRYLEYTVYPNDEFIDAVIINEMIFIIDNQMKQIFSCKNFNRSICKN